MTDQTDKRIQNTENGPCDNQRFRRHVRFYARAIEPTFGVETRALTEAILCSPKIQTAGPRERANSGISLPLYIFGTAQFQIRMLAPHLSMRRTDGFVHAGENGKVHPECPLPPLCQPLEIRPGLIPVMQAADRASP